MVEATLRVIDPNVPYTAVHASGGKVVRAEPVAALYEQQPGGCFTSARSRPSKIRCAGSLRTSIERLRGFLLTA